MRAVDHVKKYLLDKYIKNHPLRINNTSRLRFLLTLTLAVVNFYLAQSQDTLLISKNELLEKVLTKNLQLKISTESFKSAQADYIQTNSLFLPNINMTYNGMVTNNPLMAFGSKLNQEILTARDFDPSLLNNPEKTQNFATKLEILQPIINFDGILGRQAAKAKMDAFQLQSNRTKEYIEFQVVDAFMQLQLAFQAVKVLEKTDVTGKANLKLVENYFSQGMLQKTDLLNTLVRENEITNQLLNAKSNVQNASDYLAFLLNEDPIGKIYKPTDTLESSIAVETFPTTLSEDRKDVQAMNKSTIAYEKIMQSNKVQFLPRLNAFGSYEMYDNNFGEFDAKGYLIGVQLSWNVFDGYKSIGKYYKSRADYQKVEVETDLYKKQSQLELNKANRQLSDLENKVRLSKLVYEQAQEAFRIRQNRFEQGLEKTIDLLQSETLMVQKEMEHLQTVYHYNYAIQYLRFLNK